MPYKPPSLHAQAVALLAQREHSELELRRKLLRRLRKDADRATAKANANAFAGQAEACAALSRATAHDPDAVSTAASSTAQIDDVVTWLRERGYLDEARFVDARIHARAGRFGPARIAQELSRHGLELPAEVAQNLRSTELEQATQLWQRKFGHPAADAREAARQARFLTGRGFSGEVVHQILRTAARRRSEWQEGG